MDEEREKRLDCFLRRYEATEENLLKGIHREGFSRCYYDEKRKAHQMPVFRSIEPFYILKHKRFSPVSPHYHDFIELSIMYSGRCTQIIDGQTITLQQGDISMIDCNTVHSIENTGENDIMINILLCRDYMAKSILSQLKPQNILTTFFINAITSESSDVNYLVFNAGDSPRIQGTILELLYENFFPGEMHQQILEGYFYLLMMQMTNLIDMRTAVGKLNKSSTTLVKALRYIEQNYLTATLESVADAVHISPAYLTSLMTKQCGKSCMGLIIEKRMQHASNRLLEGNTSVDSIARELGYSNQTYFYRKFREQFGCSPAQYRQRFGQDMIEH